MENFEVDPVKAVQKFDQEDVEFPMIVYLRGDEDYFNEFSLNADQVMNLLGIKRSRLNQISGKDLRVGRTRIENYIRPVYRQIDVDQYLNWIRPTATHKKSSELLNEAREKLERQSTDLSLQLSSSLDSIVKEFTEKIVSEFFEQKKYSKNILLKMEKQLLLSILKTQSLNRFQNKKSKQSRQSIENILSTLATLDSDLQELKISSLHGNDIIRHNERMLIDIMETLQVQNKILTDQIEKLSCELQEIKKKIPYAYLVLPMEKKLRARHGIARKEIAEEKPVKFARTRKVNPYVKKRRPSCM